MISHEEALQLIGRHVGALGEEDQKTGRCAGRILAADVVSRVASPPFNKAAMDGFAVRACDVLRLPVDLTLAGRSFAGQPGEPAIGPGQCACVATGAPVPDGADMVVMVEHTRQLPDSKVRIEKLSGKNICQRGEDIENGQLVLRAGQALTPMKVGVAASAGHERLTVYRMPSVALLCTGTEVREPGVPVQDGKIYNSNGPMLGSLLAPLSSDYEYLGIAKDNETNLKDAIQQGLSRDVLVIAGGVSVGRYDLVPAVLKDLGAKIIFHRCAIKPGKPVLFAGHEGGTCVFGLPGNPQSCFVVFHVLLRAVLALMSGAQELPPVYQTGQVRESLRNRPERKNFRPCRVEVRNGINHIVPVPYTGSADIMGPSVANAYMVVQRGVEQVEPGDILEFFEV